MELARPCKISGEKHNALTASGEGKKLPASLVKIGAWVHSKYSRDYATAFRCEKTFFTRPASGFISLKHSVKVPNSSPTFCHSLMTRLLFGRIADTPNFPAAGRAGTMARRRIAAFSPYRRSMHADASRWHESCMLVWPYTGLRQNGAEIEGGVLKNEFTFF